MIRISRRDFAALAAAALLERPALAQTDAGPILTRAVPSTGEHVAAVGLGTARGFDSDDERTRRAAAKVVRMLVESGGQLIDTASTYGDAESVLGNVIATADLRNKIFIATPTSRSSSAPWHGSRRRSSTCCSSTT